jgi:DNA-binding MarR family transcriptional regulator
MVSRQNLSGLITRMERDGHVQVSTDARDRRSRLVVMTESGRHVWLDLAVPKIKAYYEQALADFSMGDMAHTLHYFLKLLDNMEKIDHAAAGEEEPAEEAAAGGRA